MDRAPFQLTSSKSAFRWSFRRLALAIIFLAGSGLSGCASRNNPVCEGGLGGIIVALGCLAVYSASQALDEKEAEERAVEPVSYALDEKEAEEIAAKSRAAAKKQARLRAQKQIRISELKPRVEQGDTEATIELVALTGNLAPLKTLAAGGNPKAAYALFEQLSGERQTTNEAW